MIEQDVALVLREIHVTLEDHDVRCWLDQGMLLGAILNQCMLKDDTDIDFGVRSIDLKPLLKALEVLRAIGFEVWFEPNNIFLRKNNIPVTFAIYHYDYATSTYVNTGYPALTRWQQYFQTLYGYALHRGLQTKFGKSAKLSRWLTWSRIARWWIRNTHNWVWQHLLRGETFPQATPALHYLDLWKTTFYGCVFYTPRFIEKYLSFKYGADWRVPPEKRDPPIKWEYATMDGGAVLGKELFGGKTERSTIMECLVADLKI